MSYDLLLGKSKCQKCAKQILFLSDISSKYHNNECDNDDEHDRRIHGRHIRNGIALVDRHGDSRIRSCRHIACNHIILI